MVPVGNVFVVTVGGAESVSIVPPKFEPEPTASQFAGLAHDTSMRAATPAGTVCPTQLAPPSAVTEIAPDPTTVQAVALMQLTPVSMVPAGLPRSFHCEPASVVATTAEPVATHDVSVLHDTAFSVVTPAGTLCGDHVVPPLTVEMMATPGPVEDTPTAVQSWLPAQDTPLKSVMVAGKLWGVHEVPPFVVAMIAGADVSNLLTATQLDVVGHETPERTPVFAGTLSVIHVTPPSDVVMMTGLSKMPKPTAVQFVVVGQEMEFKPLTSVGMVSDSQA